MNNENEKKQGLRIGARITASKPTLGEIKKPKEDETEEKQEQDSE